LISPVCRFRGAGRTEKRADEYKGKTLHEKSIDKDRRIVEQMPGKLLRHNRLTRSAHT
jgi:hypothetical protein